MARQYQCLSTLSWVHSIPCGSQPLSSQWRHSDTSVGWQYLHVISGGRRQSCDLSQSETLREIQDNEPRPGTPIPRRRNTPQWYRDQSRTESLYRHYSQTIRHGAHSRCLDAHGSRCKIGLCRGSGGEGIGRYHGLSSGRGITNVRSTCNSARDLVCGCCSFSLQFVATHHLYDRCWEHPSVSQIYSRFSTTLQGSWHRHWHWHWHWHRLRHYHWHWHWHWHQHHHRHRHRHRLRHRLPHRH